MEVTITNESTTTEPPTKNGQQPKPMGWGGLNAFYWYQIFVLDSAVDEARMEKLKNNRVEDKNGKYDQEIPQSQTAD